MEPRERSNYEILRQYFVISVLALCIYFNTVFGSFVFDDIEAILKNKDILPQTPISDVFKNDFWGTDITSNISHKSYRPLVILSFRLNLLFADSELDSIHFHIVNVVSYIILCNISLSVLHLFTSNKDKENIAFISCILFTIHPVHTEVVAGIVGRADLFAAILYLSSYLLFHKAVKNRSHLYLFIAIILIVVATLCKEIAITALALFVVHDFVYSKSWKSINLQRTVILLISAIAIVFARFKIMNFEGPNFTAVDNPAAFADDLSTRIFTYNYIYMLNILLLIWPQWLCFDWSMGCIPLVKDFRDFRIIFVIGFWLLGLCSLLKFLHLICTLKIKKFKGIILAVSFILLPFLPASNLFLKVGFVIAERILLLPSLGFSYLVVLGFTKLYRQFQNNRQILNVLFYVLCLVFTFRTIERNSEWLTETRLFNSALDICPLNAKVHYNVAKVSADNNRKPLAIEEYRRAIELNPLYEQAMNNLANLLREEKQYKSAELLLRKALDIRPNFAAAWMNLGIVLTNLNRPKEAESCYLKAITFREKYSDCYYNLGNLYLDLKRNEEALKAWVKAVYFRQTHTAAWSNMLVLLDSLKRYDKALQIGNTALMYNPMSAALHFSIANTLGKVQDFEKAEKHFLEALNLNPNNALYYSNLGVLYHRWGQPQKAMEMYKKSLQINPHMKTAESNLRKLVNVPPSSSFL